MARPKVHCWCGQIRTEGRSHYPGNNPENGPAHRPQPPCRVCGQGPHSGPCFPICRCEAPNHLFCDGLHICANCGDEASIGTLTLTEHLVTAEPETFGPFGLKSEHVTLHILRSNGNSNIGSALAVALSRWISNQEGN